MTSKDIRAKAKAFLKEFKLEKVVLSDLKAVLKKQGYTLVEFNSVYNTGAVDTLIKALGVETKIVSSKGFTYVDANQRIVFLNEDLSDEEKLIVLAHEEGHIYCGHLYAASIIGVDVVEEYEANEFVHYLLNNSTGRKIKMCCSEHKKGIIITLAVAVIAVVCLIVLFAVAKEQSYHGKYYITSTGNKYHEEDCMFVKDKSNIQRLTKEQFESGEYEPCKTCLPK